MKNVKAHVTWTVLSVLTIALGSAAFASAAPNDDDKVSADVPFDFTVGESQLPAGHYVISAVEDDASVVAITSADGKRSVYVTTIPEAPDSATSSPELVFDKLGNTYSLAAFTLEGTDGHRTVLAPGGESHEIPVS